MKRKSGIFFATLIIAIGGIIYEMVIGATSSYLLGNSVLHFSLTIGIFLFGMGIGSYISKLFSKNPERNFVLIEIILGITGGSSVMILFSTFAFTEMFYPVFTFLVIFIGILIGSEIPVLLAILKESNKDSLYKSVSNLLSIDYIGALFASVLFPLFLLPQLGLLRTSFLVGILNLLIALLMIFSFSKYIKNIVLITILWVIGIVVLILGFFQHQNLTSILNSGLYQDEVIYSAESSYQNIVITKFNDDIRLFLDGNIQFSSIDEYRYHESLIHVPVKTSGQVPENVLVLGGGDGLAIRELLKYQEIKSITLVELDPKMIEIAKDNQLITEINENSLSNEKVRIVTEDAFNFLESTSELYNFIVIDLPDPNNESLSKLYSLEFYSLAAQHLSEDGYLVTQAVSPYFTNDTFWTINTTLLESFRYTVPYHINVPAFGEWGFVMAFNHEFLDRGNNIDISQNKIINSDEIIESLKIFDSDLTQQNEVEISTLFQPNILYRYQEEVANW